MLITHSPRVRRGYRGIVGGGQPTLLRHQKWDTLTDITVPWGSAPPSGPHNASLRGDGSTSPFDNVGNANNNARIITAASRSLQHWPTPNALYIGAEGVLIASCQVQWELGAPVAGAHRYFRDFVQCLWEDDHDQGIADTDLHEHGTESADDWSGGGDGYQFAILPRGNGTWFPSWREISPGTGGRWYANGVSLLKNKTYRREWHLHYGASTYTVEIKLFDAETGVQVVDTADFDYSNVGSTVPLPGVAIQYTASDHAWVRWGTTGPSSNYPLANMSDNDPLLVVGAVAYTDAGWIGDFNGAVE